MSNGPTIRDKDIRLAADCIAYIRMAANELPAGVDVTLKSGPLVALAARIEASSTDA
jgi:hypothetical protein